MGVYETPALKSNSSILKSLRMESARINGFASEMYIVEFQRLSFCLPFR